MASKILVVEDTPDVRDTLKNTLIDNGYSAHAVANESDAIVAISSPSDLFNFALIDMRLHDGGEDDKSGLSLAMAIHTLKPEIRIIMLSRYIRSSQIVRAVRFHGVIDFIDKNDPDWLNKNLMLAISEAEQSALEQPNDKAKNASRFSYSLVPSQSVVIRVRGYHVCTIFTSEPMELELNDYVNMERIVRDEMDFERRRFSISKIGKDLWKDLFRSHFDVERAYAEACAKSSLVTMQFEMPREISSLPLEFVRADGNKEFLILKHPFSRFLIGVTPKCEAISPNLLALSEKLRILLIASNTVPPIAGVDEEINQLKKFFDTQDYFPVKIDVIPTEEASREHIRKVLKNANYDIVHYAGHGHFDMDSPEETRLFFWEGKNKAGHPVPMTAAELKLLMDQSNVRFMYLSCCYGTAAGASSDLINDDFIGLADAIVQAGVPSVLGYRWSVSDKKAIELAGTFYRSLLEQGSIDVALWQARCELAVDRNDKTWLSPILIHQM
jgi:CheY-like chemotaxis protein